MSCLNVSLHIDYTGLRYEFLESIHMWLVRGGSRRFMVFQDMESDGTWETVRTGVVPA